MTHKRPHVDRALQLNSWGYTAREVLEAMNEEGRDVLIEEVKAWIGYHRPPQVVEYRGTRVTLSSVAIEHDVALNTLRARVRDGMPLEEVIQALREEKRKEGPRKPAAHPWATAAVPPPEVNAGRREALMQDRAERRRVG